MTKPMDYLRDLKPNYTNIKLVVAESSSQLHSNKTSERTAQAQITELLKQLETEKSHFSAIMHAQKRERICFLFVALLTKWLTIVKLTSARSLARAIYLARRRPKFIKNNNESVGHTEWARHWPQSRVYSQERSNLLSRARRPVIVSIGAVGHMGALTSTENFLKIISIGLALSCGSLPFAVYTFQQTRQGASAINQSEKKTKTMVLNHQDSVASALKLVAVNPHRGSVKSAHEDQTIALMITPEQAGIDDHYETVKALSSKDEKTRPIKPFFLRAVVDGLAMIEYDSGYWFVLPGKVLPDGSTYVSATKNPQTGTWQIETSDRNIINQQT